MFSGLRSQWMIFSSGVERNSSAVQSCCENFRVRLRETPRKLVLRNRSYRLYERSSNTRQRWLRHMKWRFSRTGENGNTRKLWVVNYQYMWEAFSKYVIETLCKTLVKTSTCSYIQNRWLSSLNKIIRLVIFCLLPIPLSFFNNFFLNFQNTVDITGLLFLVDSLNKVIKKLM